MTFLFSISKLETFLHTYFFTFSGPDAKAQKCPHKNGSQLEALKVKKYRKYVNRVYSTGIFYEYYDKSDPIYPKYFKQSPYTVAPTTDCVCSKFQITVIFFSFSS